MRFARASILLLLAACAHQSQQQPAQHHHEQLGAVHFPVSCSRDSQQQFDRAMALLHHMTYPEGRVEFERLLANDPQCAMAHWGVAMTLFQPLWPMRPTADDLQRGFNEVQLARSAPSAREKLFVDAAEAFYSDPASTDYWARIRRWEEAAKRAYDALPNDHEAMVFYALAHLATTPADRITRDHADRAAEILLRVHRENPHHPGAMHYLVHANDVPGRERELLDITRTYESLAPRNPHALHMPTHIYTRLGDWDGVIRGNLLAAEAALEQPAGAHGEYVWDEFAHAIEYLIYAYLQKGDDASARAQLDRLRATQNIQPTFKTAFHIASTQARYALERRAWSEAAALVPRQPSTLDWDRFTWPEAIVVFAKGRGALQLGDVATARNELARLVVLETKTRNANEELFARNIGVLRLELSAWIEKSEPLMREAVELEATTPKHAVTPAPTIPALEQLGDLLLELQRPDEARQAFERALEVYPNRRAARKFVKQP